MTKLIASVHRMAGVVPELLHAHSGGSMFVQRHNPSGLRIPSKHNEWRLYERPLKTRSEGSPDQF